MSMPLPANLEEYEAQMEVAPESEPQVVLLLPTLADAQRALARVRYFRQKAAEVEGVFASEIAILEQELARVKADREQALQPWQRRESWYVMALEQYAREQNAADPKLKTIKLPAGDMSLRAQQPKWEYFDEEDLQGFLEDHDLGCIRVKRELDKATLKKCAIVKAFICATNPTGRGHGWVRKLWIDRDFADEPKKHGRVSVVNEETGEVFEVPGVQVVEQPPKFEIKV